MYTYVLLLLGYSCLPNNKVVKLLHNNSTKNFINHKAHSLIGAPIHPQLSANSVNKNLVPTRYKKYIMTKGEGLWQVAIKKHVAKKDMTTWIALVAKKNKLLVKDNNDNYILNTGDIIWIPL